MNACKPFGDMEKTKILIIGHDPKLQRSDAQAQYVFFLDYLERPPPAHPSERRKYDFASSVVSYIKYLTGSNLSLEDMLFTNLCNEFLERPIDGGTVLITDDAADRGLQTIESILQRGSFKLIFPMAPQVFYHLVRTGFVPHLDENLGEFIGRAQPRRSAKERKAYVPNGQSPFLLVCGRLYRHRRDHTPIIPVVHVKQWPLNSRMAPHYDPLMKMAATNAVKCLQERHVAKRGMLGSP